MQDKNKILNFIKTNKAITKIDEVIVKFPDVKQSDINTPEIVKALENNRVEMQLMLKTKLFKNDTTQSLIELNKILNQEENNSNKSNDYINNLTERWFTGE